jgi:hypothetical protein
MCGAEKVIVSVKTRVRDTSETVVGDEGVQDQRHWNHRVREVGIQLNIPTMSTPDFSYVLCLCCMCGTEKVRQLINQLRIVYYSSRKRELKTRHICECQCDER